MNISVQTYSPAALAQVETEALVAILAQADVAGWAAPLDQAAGGALGELVQTEEFSGRALELAHLYRPAGLKAKRLVLAGKGESHFGPLEMWRVAGLVVRQLKAKGVHQVALILPPGMDALVAARTAITGVEAANFETDAYKSDRKPEKRVDALTLLVPAGTDVQAVEGAAREAAIIADGHRFARDLANEPSNRMTPTILAQRAQAMAKDAGLECELIDEARARELKMGAFLAVAQGSVEPPMMMILRYRGAPASKTLLALVGKGITFDTGGISIKPAANMDLMKFDMAGGAATLGAIKAIAGLKLKVNVLAIVPAAENMPGGRAQKPGDVQTAMSGKTIEVLNTDAEGRLVLADGLHYARQLGATHLVDSATLTGAVVVALGNVNTGVFANNEEFYRTFEQARQVTGEKMWRLPLDQEYADLLKGSVGDLVNIGGRWGGAITAAQFLQEFVDDTPWIHLDIAGTAWLEENKSWMPKGPTGVPCYTLIELARTMAQS